MRKLCVTCSDSSGTVRIKVQANGLPNHCLNATVNNALPTENTWEVNFNADVSSVMNYDDDDFDTSAKTDEILCDLQRTSSANMNAVSDYSLNGDRRILQAEQSEKTGWFRDDPPSMEGGGGGEVLGTSAGIALSGGYIYNALAGGNVDAVENEGDTLDVCMSHASPTSDFHYHLWSGCWVKDYGFWSDSDATLLCRDEDDCVTAPATYTKTNSASG